MELSAALSDQMNVIRKKEESPLVPAATLAVSEREQHHFNSKVIRQLRAFDSRLHLVGMHDASWKTDNESERKLSEQEIPFVARAMIGRWRNTLYKEQAGILEETCNGLNNRNRLKQ